MTNKKKEPTATLIEKQDGTYEIEIVKTDGTKETIPAPHNDPSQMAPTIAVIEKQGDKVIGTYSVPLQRRKQPKH